MNELTGLIFDIQRFSLGNGPGIRTTVFMKGCPLRCLWCCNPESTVLRPQVMLNPRLCKNCGVCAAVCPNGVHRMENGAHIFEPENCVCCGKCAEACCYAAVKLAGREYGLQALLKLLLDDQLYYSTSGGGVTFSGGEPTMQAEFVAEAARRLKAQGVHVALNTCGHCAHERFAALLSLFDLALFDIKHMDSEKHACLTGVGNETILKNLKYLIASGKPFKLRYPMIPQCNDGEENLAAMAAFLNELGVCELDVSVYHDFGAQKYYSLGLKPQPIDKYTDEQVQNRLAFLEQRGIHTVII